MNKSQLRTWLEMHRGPEWEEERIRMFEEYPEISADILRDVISDMISDMRVYISESIDDTNEIDIDVEEQLNEMELFPEVAELLKRF